MPWPSMSSCTVRPLATASSTSRSVSFTSATSSAVSTMACSTSVSSGATADAQRRSSIASTGLRIIRRVLARRKSALTQNGSSSIAAVVQTSLWCQSSSFMQHSAMLSSEASRIDAHSSFFSAALIDGMAAMASSVVDASAAVVTALRGALNSLRAGRVRLSVATRTEYSNTRAASFSSPSWSKRTPSAFALIAMSIPANFFLFSAPGS
mmetsp:Transcript_3246/g.6755  ORF Transcript_3246/g.6755 Transcript_3246/m.6755 type:complete len:209 (-) Transcript_3246:132-758(-)